MTVAAHLLGACGGGVLLALMVWLPGWCVSRCAGLRGWPVLAAAPGATAALVAASATGLGVLGWRWQEAGPPTVAALAALVGAALARTTRVGGRGSARRTEAHGACRAGRRSAPGTRTATGARAAAETWRLQAPVAGAVLVSAVISVAAYAWGAVSAQWPAQAFDAVFHLSAVAAVREGGNASPLGGLEALYQAEAVYYPTPWHALVALLPGGVPLATNAALVGTGALLWPCALAGMLMGVRDLIPGPEPLRRWAVALSVLLGGNAVAFTVLLTSLAVWPYALSTLALPGVLLLLHRLVGCLDADSAQASRADAHATASLLVLSAAGAVAAHGAGVFSLLVLGLAWLPVLWRILTRSMSSRARRLLATVAVLVVAAGAWVARRPLGGVLGYQRGDGGWGGLVATLGQVLADLPAYGGVWSWSGLLGVVTGVLTLVGAGRAWHLPTGRCWLGTWFSALVLTVLVGGPSWWGRQLGSPWYLQKARLAPLVLLPALLLVAVACAHLLARLRASRCGRSTRSGLSGSSRHVPRRAAPAVALVLVVLLAAAGRLPLQRDLVASVHDPTRIQYGTLVTAREAAFIQETSSLLPDGAVVVGAPSRGASLLWALGGVHVVYPTRSSPASGSAQLRLAQAWPLLAEPGAGAQEVCELLAELGAGYLYTDASPDAEGAHDGQPPYRWDAALGQLPEGAVDLVASDGDYALWRITACQW